jgi:hypothetical protein
LGEKRLLKLIEIKTKQRKDLSMNKKLDVVEKWPFDGDGWIKSHQPHVNKKGKAKRACSLSDCDWTFSKDGQLYFGLSNGKTKTLFTNPKIEEAGHSFLPDYFYGDGIWEAMSHWVYLNQNNTANKTQRYSVSTSEDLMTLLFVECLIKKEKVNAFSQRLLGRAEAPKEILFGGQIIYPRNKKTSEYLENFKDVCLQAKEDVSRLTEPDLIFIFEKDVCFIEVKAGSSIAKHGGDLKGQKTYREKENDHLLGRGWGAIYNNPQGPKDSDEPLYEIFRNVTIGSSFAQKLQKSFRMFTLTPHGHADALETFNAAVKEPFKAKALYWEDFFNDLAIYPCKGCSDCSKCFFRENLQARLAFILELRTIDLGSALVKVK